MSSKSSKGHAVVVMPSTTAGLANLPALRLWLSRGQLRRQSRREELLNRVLTAIGHVSVSQGLAALRLWGQTGDRPEIWVSAADPVYLEPMLDHLRLHALRGAELPAPHLRTVYDHLLRALGIDGQFSLARIGQYGYLRGDKPIATASMSAAVAEGGRPDELMPQGTDAVAHDSVT